MHDLMLKYGFYNFIFSPYIIHITKQVKIGHFDNTCNFLMYETRSISPVFLYCKSKTVCHIPIQLSMGVHAYLGEYYAKI